MNATNEPLTLTVEDAVTGERRTRAVPHGAFFWTEGDGGCDCNRREMFFPEHDLPEWVSELAVGEMYCAGSVRYRVVDVQPMPEGYTPADFNEGYSEPA